MKNGDGDIDLESGDPGGAETTNSEREVMIPMISEVEATTEAGAQVTLQGMACDGSDMEPITEHEDQSMNEVTEPGESQEKKNSEYLKAAAKGKFEIMVAILNNGADILSKDEKGNSALHRAAMEGHDEIVKELLDRGLDVNLRGWNDWTPLIWAAFSGQESTFNILLEASADVTCRSKAGLNALMLLRSEQIICEL